MTIDWGPRLVGQLEFYWDAHLWPRIQGLTDDEYLWEPVNGCWSIHPGADGTWTADDAWPPPDPAPVTTIAWRMQHIAIGCFADRARLFFDIGGDDSLPATADGGLTFLDDTYHRWHDAIAALDSSGIDAPLGERGGPFAEEPMGELILHINREVMHHSAEIALLRDLYRAKFS